MKVKQEQTQQLSTELSFKLMEVGQVILELEEDYLHVMGRRMQARLQHVANEIRELSEQMSGSTGERMLKWREDIRRRTQQGFM